MILGPRRARRRARGPLVDVRVDGVAYCGVCRVPIVGRSPATGVTRIVGWQISETPDGRCRVVLHADGTVLHECGRNLGDALAEQLSVLLAEPATLDAIAPAHERAES